MFSKKPQLATQTPAAAPAAGGSRLKQLATLPISNPYVGAAGAAVLLLASVGVMVATGDPRAGAPSVHVALGGTGAGLMPVTPDGAAAAATPGQTPDGTVDPDAIAMAPIDTPAFAASPYGGQAVITLPNGQQQLVPLGGGGAVQPLAPAPIAGLSQPGPGGALPIIAADGRTPAQAYARPFTANGKPRVAIVVGGLGLDPSRTQDAIDQLPPEVTLSFPVTGVSDLQGWINKARQRGHEVMLEIPMEPKSYPNDDPGPDTLLANARRDDMLKRLDVLLARASGYFGVANYQGSKFVTSATAMDAFSTGLRRRGLAFIDDGSAAQSGGGISRASADRVIDEQPGVDTIGYQLTQLEQIATRRGSALGSGIGYALTIRQVAAWAQGLPARGLQLAPASAVTTRR